ncbi:MAG: hypothetical protein HFI91_10320 [Lachnospiraceae bacterium]|nr:hypothetical protein [Lachnospiraceae bacterium]
MKKEADKIPVWEKYTLTIAEASDYFNIGESKLRRFLSEHERRYHKPPLKEGAVKNFD